MTNKKTKAKPKSNKLPPPFDKLQAKSVNWFIYETVAFANVALGFYGISRLDLVVTFCGFASAVALHDIKGKLK